MRLPALVALTAVLALPASAHAKEISAFDVCGTNGCTRIDDRAALSTFDGGDDMAAAAPGGAQRSYLVRVHVRGEGAGAGSGWSARWLPAVGLLAYGQPKGRFLFTSVSPQLERTLRGAVRGRTARAARRYLRTAASLAPVEDVVPAPRAAGSAPGHGGLSPFAWVGAAAGLLLVGGAVRARRR